MLGKQPTIKSQSGAALIISLIILLLLTIIGVSGMQTTTLEEKMAGNMRDKELAFEAAEAALRNAENFMETVFTKGAFNSDGSDGLYDNAELKIWEVVDWSGTNATNTNKAADTIQMSTGAEAGYVVQFVADSEDENISGGHNLENIGEGTGSDSASIFRITARGTSPSGTAQVVLQTVYGRKL